MKDTEPHYPKALYTPSRTFMMANAHTWGRIDSLFFVLTWAASCAARGLSLCFLAPTGCSAGMEEVCLHEVMFRFITRSDRNQFWRYASMHMSITWKCHDRPWMIFSCEERASSKGLFYCQTFTLCLRQCHRATQASSYFHRTKQYNPSLLVLQPIDPQTLILASLPLHLVLAGWPIGRKLASDLTRKPVTLSADFRCFRLSLKTHCRLPKVRRRALQKLLPTSDLTTDRNLSHVVLGPIRWVQNIQQKLQLK